MVIINITRCVDLLGFATAPSPSRPLSVFPIVSFGTAIDTNTPSAKWCRVVAYFSPLASA